MSYINKALQKAQKEKESPYVPYVEMITAPGKINRREVRLRFIAGFFMVSALAVMIVSLLYIQGEKKSITAPLLVVKAAKPDQVKIVPPAVVPAATVSMPQITAGTFPNAPLAANTKGVAVAVVPKADVVDVKSMFAQALQKQNEGKLVEAKELYKKVIKGDPHNVQALNNLGVVYMNKKNYKWAIIRFNDALAIKPDYIDARYNLACLYSQKKDVARSFHYLKSAIELNPEVRNWARKDSDLKELSRFPDFNNLLEGQEN